jgi:hypothetical protein
MFRNQGVLFRRCSERRLEGKVNKEGVRQERVRLWWEEMKR